MANKTTKTAKMTSKNKTTKTAVSTTTKKKTQNKKEEAGMARNVDDDGNIDSDSDIETSEEMFSDEEKSDVENVELEDKDDENDDEEKEVDESDDDAPKKTKKTKKQVDDDDCLYNHAPNKGEDDDDDDFDDYDDLGEQDDTQTHAKTTNGLNIVPKEERISKPFLTKYERVRIKSIRAQNLLLGAKPMILDTSNVGPKELADIEMREKMCPLIIRRPMPDGSIEEFEVSELEIIN